VESSFVNNDDEKEDNVAMKSKWRRLLRRLERDGRATFCFAFIVGSLLAVLHHVVSNWASNNASANRPGPSWPSYEAWLNEQGFHSHRVDPDQWRYGRQDGPESSLPGNAEIAFLRQQVPVACLVFPTSASAASALRDTWGGHCDELFFFSHKIFNESIPIRGRRATSAFHQLCSALKTVKEECKRCKWALVATEDTFALLENLRMMVAPLNASDAHYLGHAMTFWGKEYNWGDAGYALSKGALDALSVAFPTEAKCEEGGRFWKNADWYLGKHLAELGVFPVDTRDELGKGRFNGYTFNKMLFPGAISLFDR